MATATATLAQSLRDDTLQRVRLRQVCSVSPNASIEEVVACMVSERVGCALVMEGANLVGIFTERDFVSRVVAAGLETSSAVNQVMTPAPKTLKRNASVREAIELMQHENGGYRHIPVLDDDGQPVGVLSVKDIVHYLVEYFPANVYNLPPRPDEAFPAREGA
jgi:CBS domain-containing protein